MGSIQQINDGSHLSYEELNELKNAVKGTIVLKNEASSADYYAAVKRWNAVCNKPAVSDYLD